MLEEMFGMSEIRHTIGVLIFMMYVVLELLLCYIVEMG